ncbi:MAG: hypothetical protein LBJ03_00615 [Holosporales bacterium]|nr:hypothetical protein [Holosporales bacterium]
MLQSAWPAAPQPELKQPVSLERVEMFGNQCLRQMGSDERFDAEVLPTSAQSDTNTPGYVDPQVFGFGPFVVKVSRQRGSGELKSAFLLDRHLKSRFGDGPAPADLPRIVNVIYFSIISILPDAADEDICVWHISRFGDCESDEVMHARIDALSTVYTEGPDRSCDIEAEWDLQFMERAPGVSLGDFLGIIVDPRVERMSPPKMGWPSAFPIMKEFGRAVRSLNEIGITHKDLHHNNVFVSKSASDPAYLARASPSEVFAFIDWESVELQESLTPEDRLNCEVDSLLFQYLFLCIFKEHAPCMIGAIRHTLEGYNEGCAVVELSFKTVRGWIIDIASQYENYPAGSDFLLTIPEVYESLCKTIHEIPFLERPKSLDPFASSFLCDELRFVGIAFYDLPAEDIIGFREMQKIAPQEYHKWLFPGHIDPERPASHTESGSADQ